VCSEALRKNCKNIFYALLNSESIVMYYYFGGGEEAEGSLSKLIQWGSVA
jgi:hypothetical protein